MESRTHCTDACSSDVGYLLIRETFDIMQHKNGTLVIRKFYHRCSYYLALLFGIELLRWIRHIVRELVQLHRTRVIVRALRVERNQLKNIPSLSRSHDVHTEIVSDSKHPGRERGLMPELIEILMHFHERILNHFFCLFGVA
jgi:hypothetical protein